MKTTEATIPLGHDLKLNIHESGESEPIGIIIDLYRDDEHLDSWTFHYEDYEQ